MNTELVMDILGEHSFEARVVNGTIEARVHYSRMNGHLVIHWSEFEVVPCRNVKELRDWLGY